MSSRGRRDRTWTALDLDDGLRVRSFARTEGEHRRGERQESSNATPRADPSLDRRHLF